MKKTWAQQYIIELIILPILLLIFTASFYMQSQTEFIDTDDCMRLVRRASPEAAGASPAGGAPERIKIGI